MAREPIIGGAGSHKPPANPSVPTGGMGAPEPRDERLDEELRPKKLADVVGQRKVVERLQIILNACRKRKEPLGHLLFDGPPGLGKTTFSTVLPRELGVECHITSGPALNAPKDLL